MELVLVVDYPKHSVLAQKHESEDNMRCSKCNMGVSKEGLCLGCGLFQEECTCTVG